MNTTTTARSRSGSRRALPESADRACAACGEPRGKKRIDWHRITATGPNGVETVVGWTCPDCPRWDEPIRREIAPTGRVRFLAVVDSTPRGARRRRQAKRRTDSLEEARAFVRDVRAEVAQSGRYALKERETLDEICDRWLESRHDVRIVTVDGYRSALKAIRRHIGTEAVVSVTRADLERLVTRLAADGGARGRPLSPRSIRASLVALGQVFDMAVRDDLIATNPVRGVKPPRARRAVGADIQHWQPAELLRFRDCADSDAYAGAWRLTLAGLTRADVMGLRWSDINFDAGTVTVRQGRVQLSKGDATDEPKSPQRRRTVPVEQIHPGTMALLRTMKAAQAADRLAAGGSWLDSGMVVVDALGMPIRPEAYSDRFHRLCVAAGVPSIRLHSVRHSLAFWLHSLGVTPAAAAALLGHTVEVHLSTYLPESGADGIAAAAAALSQAIGGRELRAV